MTVLWPIDDDRHVSQFSHNISTEEATRSPLICRRNAVSCPDRKSYPNERIVQATEVRNGLDPAFPLDRPAPGRVFVQGQMGAGAAVIVGVRSEHSAQMRLVGDDQMIQSRVGSSR